MELQLDGIVDRHLTVKEDHIRIVNAPPAGLHPEIVTKEVQVPIRGKISEVQRLLNSGGEGILIELDLSDCTEPGSYTIQGIVVNSGGSKVSAKNVEISVMVSDEAPSEAE